MLAQRDAPYKRQLESRCEGRSESIGGSAGSRHRRVTRRVHEKQHPAKGRRRQEIGRFGAWPEGRADAGTEGFVTELNVVQKSAAFSVLLSGSPNPLQSEGYGAGDRDRTGDVQLGKLTVD